MTDWLKEIRERCEKATPGPWEIETTEDGRGIITSYEREWDDTNPTCKGHIVSSLYGVLEDRDAEFIALAREDIPKLLEEVEMLKVLKEGYKRLAEKYKSSLEVIELQAINGNRNNRLCRVIEDTARQALEESK